MFHPQFNLMSTISDSFRSLTRLQLMLTTEKVVDVIGFICSFPHLQKLNIRADALDAREDQLSTVWTPNTYQLPPTLEYVDIPASVSRHTIGRDVWNSWMNVQPPLSLKGLSLFMFPVYKATSIDLAQSLETLRFDVHVHPSFSHFLDINSFTKSVNLPNFISLETLTLDVPYIGDYELLHLLRLYGRIILSIPSTGPFQKLSLLIQSVVITGPPDGYRESDLIKDWVLDRIAHGFSSSPLVEVHTQCKDSEYHEDRIARIFPRCFNSGRLIRKVEEI
ncbi:hypothetical protein PQX77_020215 [Marasmius sp. AFHP31]|nr:hypothetical protein PQX77_020215 [Marasmius sp. AFHP31]